MKIKKIIYSPHFSKAFKNISKQVQIAALEKENLFKNNCFDSRLKTHKLHGKLSGFWAFSITYSYRILFKFIDDETVGFIDIGDHSIYD